MSSPQTLCHADLSLASRTLRLFPGLALTGIIAAFAFWLRDLIGITFISPLILSILVGTMIQNVIGVPGIMQSGITFSMKRLLRMAIILLGLQLTVTQISAIGLAGVIIIVGCTISTFLITKKLGVLLGVDAKLTELIAAGTSICGASAVIATNTVTKAPEEDVAYAIACVTLFGSIAVLLYPFLSGPLALGPHEFGLWSGASIHEIAQVVAASYGNGKTAGEFGTIAKLTRVLLLAPMVLSLGLFAHRKAFSGASANTGDFPWPWFVFGFMALVIINSTFAIPADIKTMASILTTVLLSMALAAMGLSTDIQKLRAKGTRPLVLGFSSFLFIAGLSLGMVKAFG